MDSNNDVTQVDSCFKIPAHLCSRILRICRDVILLCLKQWWVLDLSNCFFQLDSFGLSKTSFGQSKIVQNFYEFWTVQNYSKSSFGLSKTCPKLSKTVQNPYLPKLVIILARINFKSCDLSKTCPLKKGFGFGQVLDRVLDKCPKRQFVQLPNTGLKHHNIRNAEGVLVKFGENFAM
ncbi:hypothetical protein C1645_861354 [Glomus cerebriforme]|uniref:Uncharacterized protein n=1 Tax=Glomus cerebriforme TaxID=658196 RepID=A0A397S9U3_9GLOM|nr:hypothetical protein C1645_861354 [Glomus cerebriforme]